MVKARRIVTVFLASPGDLGDERAAVKSAVTQYNSLHADHLGYQIDLLGWEDTSPGYGRPQAIINQDLERCDLFVGLLWKRWGMPPDTSGPYTSGFDEEYQRSVERRVRTGHPEIALFFKQYEADDDPGPQLNKVIGFRERIISEKRLLYKQFTTTTQLTLYVTECITRYVYNIVDREQSEEGDANQLSPTQSQQPKDSEPTEAPPSMPFSVEGADFLRRLAPRLEGDLDNSPLPPVEAARLRLVASMVGTEGNDEATLGVHDSNLIFMNKASLRLGRKEVIGLVRSGFELYSYENTPLWHWLAVADIGSATPRWLYAVHGTSVDRRIGALAAMRTVSEPLPRGPKFHAEAIISYWLSENSPKGLKVAALGYLGECGLAADRALIKEEVDRNDTETRGAAVDALIRIALRDGREEALRTIYELQPSSIGAGLLDAVFEGRCALSNAVLLSGIKHKNVQVRREVVKLLFERHAIQRDIAEDLLSDDDAEVRYVAVKALLELGERLSRGRIRRILTPSQSVGLLGFGGLSSALLMDPGQRFLDELNYDGMLALKEEELVERSRDLSLFDMDGFFALHEKYFAKFGDALRKLTSEGFESLFGEQISRMEAGGQDSERAKGLKDYLTGTFVRRALDIICKKEDKRDLWLIRESLRTCVSNYSDVDIPYLRKFGGWEDILLISGLLERPRLRRGIGLLGGLLSDSRYRLAAEAICALARGRVAEMLDLEIPGPLLWRVVVALPKSEFRALERASLLRLLASENAMVRKVTALRCVGVLGKREIARLFADVLGTEGPRYYNVVHWLDMGVSVPTTRARLAAEKIVKELRQTD